MRTRWVFSQSASFIEVLANDEKRAAFVLAETMRLSRFRLMEDGVFRIYEKDISVERLAKELSEGGAGIRSIGRKRETLEEYFLKLVGEGLQ